MVHLKTKKILSDYSTFLKSKYINQLAEAQYNELLELLLHKNRIKFSQQELLDICKKAFDALLDDFESRNAFERTLIYLNHIKQTIFPDLENRDLQTNITRIFLIAQKQALFTFIPNYSSDMDAGIKLVQIIENEYLYILESAIQINKVEAKLLQSEKQLSLIYNSTSDMMLLISVEPAGSEFEFRFISANRTYMNVIKTYKIDVTEDSLIGKTIYEVTTEVFKIDKSAAEYVIMKYSEAARSPFPITYEESLEDPVLGRFYSETTLTPIFDEDARCTHLLYACRNITPRKLAEEEIARQRLELKRSNEELQQFAYVASHDLQEPLRMVGCFVQLLEKKYKNVLDEDANEYINFSVDGVKRMQAMLHGLLEYSRISTREYQYSLTDFNKVLENVKANLMLSIEDNGAEINFEKLPILNADENQMVRLIQNLLSNAIKYRKDEKPVITISAEKKENEWIFSVSDNGIGIKQEFFERIFNIFQRLHTRELYPGEGLGLAICKKVIERHHGRIWVESEPENGSTFFFTIPV